MNSPDLDDVLGVYLRVLPASVSTYMQETGLRKRRGIYALPVVLWLMIVQRLMANASMASCVQELTQGRLRALLPDCKRVRENRISPGTGAYCRARQKMPLELVRNVGLEMWARLDAQLREELPAVQGRVLLLDGSSLQLEHCPGLLKQYPAGENQQGAAHWPIVRMLVMHDLGTGLAHHPCWGPMYGAEAVSEQALAEAALAAVEPGTVIMGDRNFGVFSMAWAASQRNQPVWLRLTDQRARKLMGQPISKEGAETVIWRPSREDRRNPRNPEWPDNAAVTGRLIAARVGKGQAKTWLYLFTTASAPASALVDLYGQRWRIETDLRSLKQTVRLNHITARTLDTFEKELLMAVAAYNLVQAVRAMAARKAGIDPRQLSFTNVLYIVRAAWPTFHAIDDPILQDAAFQHMLDTAARCRLPKRTRSRSYPRAVWSRGMRYPSRQAEERKSK